MSRFLDSPRRWFRVGAVLFAAGALAWAHPPAYDRGLSAEDVFAHLAACDAAFLTQFTLTLTTQELVDPLAPELGWVAWKAHLSNDGPAWLFLCDEPVYTPPRYGEPQGAELRWQERYEYGEDGLRRVWRSQARGFLAEPDYLGLYTERRLLYVDAGDQVVRDQPGSPVVHHLPPGDESLLSQIWRVLWASGRGFARAIDRVQSVAVAPDGRLAVTAEGRNGVERGQWTLSIEPAAAFLVRHAAFTRSGAEQPTLVIETSGTRWGTDAAFAGVGTIAFGVQSTDVTTVAIEAFSVGRSDEERFDRLRTVLRRQPPREAVLFDERDPANQRLIKPKQ